MSKENTFDLQTQVDILYRENKLYKADKLYFLGVYYGFPKCCIKSFPKTRNYDKNNRTGFLPCETCYKKNIKLNDLIENRVCEKPFPNGNGILSRYMCIMSDFKKTMKICKLIRCNKSNTKYISKHVQQLNTLEKRFPVIKRKNKAKP